MHLWHKSKDRMNFQLFFLFVVNPIASHGLLKDWILGSAAEVVGPLAEASFLQAPEEGGEAAYIDGLFDDILDETPKPVFTMGEADEEFARLIPHWNNLRKETISFTPDYSALRVILGQNNTLQIHKNKYACPSMTPESNAQITTYVAVDAGEGKQEEEERVLKVDEDYESMLESLQAPEIVVSVAIMQLDNETYLSVCIGGTNDFVPSNFVQLPDESGNTPAIQLTCNNKEGIISVGPAESGKPRVGIAECPEDFDDDDDDDDEGEQFSPDMSLVMPNETLLKIEASQRIHVFEVE